jgi:hypothetical protein
MELRLRWMVEIGVQLLALHNLDELLDDGRKKLMLERQGCSYTMMKTKN